MFTNTTSGLYPYMSDDSWIQELLKNPQRVWTSRELVGVVPLSSLLTAYPGSVHQLHNEFSLDITTWKVRSELLVTAIWYFHQGWIFYGLSILAVLLFGYWLLSYVVLPALWRHYEHHPKLQGTPTKQQRLRKTFRGTRLMLL